MKIVIAPEKYEPVKNDIKVFLAGGITGCEDWQLATIAEIDSLASNFPEIYENLVILNPRRVEFQINDPNAATEQINWEFNMLEKCDMFSMYFSDKQL